MSGDVEVTKCDICHLENKHVSRKYYHYVIENCECCGGDDHFQIVKYCKDCTPKPPDIIKVSLKREPKESL